MKHLLIVGARGWGREVYAAIADTREVKEGDLIIKGFLDSKSDALEGLKGEYPPILCSPEEYVVNKDDVFFVAMGDSGWRKYYAEIIDNKGGRFYTYVSPDAHVLNTASIGEGSFVSRWSIISDNVTLGKHVIVHSFSVIGHDAIVKDYGTLLHAVFLGGGAEVGQCSQMSPNSMVIPHKRVGDNAMVGVGSVVMRNVKDGDSVFGNPAVRLKY